MRCWIRERFRVNCRVCFCAYARLIFSRARFCLRAYVFVPTRACFIPRACASLCARVWLLARLCAWVCFFHALVKVFSFLGFHFTFARQTPHASRRSLHFTRCIVRVSGFGVGSRVFLGVFVMVACGSGLRFWALRLSGWRFGVWVLGFRDLGVCCWFVFFGGSFG
jgi:hypothetical protein